MMKDQGKKINMGGNYFRPDMHPLATAGASLDQTVGYFNQSKAIAQSAGFFKQHFGNVDISVPQGNAINSAGKVIEGVQNYNINTPSIDSYMTIYRAVVRPVVMPFLKELGKFRDQQEVERFIQGFIDKYGESLDDKSESASAVMKAVALLTQRGGYSEDSGLDNAGEYVLPKVVSGTLGVVNSLDKTNLTRWLREKSKKVGNPSEWSATEDKAISYMRDFIFGFSTETQYTPQWDSYGNMLSSAREELQKIKEARMIAPEDIGSGMGWLMDVTAGLLETITDEEYEGLKLMASDAVKGLANIE